MSIYPRLIDNNEIPFDLQLVRAGVKERVLLKSYKTTMLLYI